MARRAVARTSAAVTSPLSIVLSASASSASEARRAVIAAVESLDRPDLADDAVLCASEPVANAVLHPGTDIDLSVLPVARGVRIGNAGHLPPMVVGPGGCGEVVDGAAAVPLGLGPGGSLWVGEPVVRQEVRTVVPKGGAVLLVSDGLVEAPSPPLTEGLELLAATAAEIGWDDVCVLAVRRLQPS